MKIIQKYLDFRYYLATVDDYVTGEDASKYPRINLFMLLDVILMLSSAESIALVYIFHVITTRYSDWSSQIFIVATLILTVLVNASISGAANFKKWRSSSFVMGVAYCFILCSILMIAILDSSAALHTLFCLNIFSIKIEVDALLIFTCVTLIAWCINSTLMYRYKVHLYRRIFVTCYNVPLQR